MVAGCHEQLVTDDFEDSELGHVQQTPAATWFSINGGTNPKRTAPLGGDTGRLQPFGHSQLSTQPVQPARTAQSAFRLVAELQQPLDWQPSDYGDSELLKPGGAGLFLIDCGFFIVDDLSPYHLVLGR